MIKKEDKHESEEEVSSAGWWCWAAFAGPHPLGQRTTKGDGSPVRSLSSPPFSSSFPAPGQIVAGRPGNAGACVLGYFYRSTSEAGPMALHMSRETIAQHKTVCAPLRAAKRAAGAAAERAEQRLHSG